MSHVSIRFAFLILCGLSSIGLSQDQDATSDVPSLHDARVALAATGALDLFNDWVERGIVTPDGRVPGTDADDDRDWLAIGDGSFFAVEVKAPEAKGFRIHVKDPDRWRRLSLVTLGYNSYRGDVQTADLMADLELLGFLEALIHRLAERWGLSRSGLRADFSLASIAGPGLQLDVRRANLGEHQNASLELQQVMITLASELDARRSVALPGFFAVTPWTGLLSNPTSVVAWNTLAGDLMSVAWAPSLDHAMYLLAFRMTHRWVVEVIYRRWFMPSASNYSRIDHCGPWLEWFAKGSLSYGLAVSNRTALTFGTIIDSGTPPPRPVFSLNPHVTLTGLTLATLFSYFAYR